MFAIARVRGHRVDSHQTQPMPTAVLQLVEGPGRTEWPPSARMHCLLSGAAYTTINGHVLSLPCGSVMVRDPRELSVCSVSRRALWLHIVGMPALADSARTCVLPLLNEPDSRCAQLLGGLARRLLALPSGMQLDATESSGWAPALESAAAEYEPLIDRCAGYSRRHKVDLFRRLARARAVLLDGCDSALPMTAVSAVASLSTPHFVRQFHRVYGDPPYRCRLRRQMQRAYAMLESGNHSVGAVMARIGIDNHCTFNRAFRQSFGRSASQVRPHAAADRAQNRPAKAPGSVTLHQRPG